MASPSRAPLVVGGAISGSSQTRAPGGSQMHMQPDGTATGVTRVWKEPNRSSSVYHKSGATAPPPDETTAPKRSTWRRFHIVVFTGVSDVFAYKTHIVTAERASILDKRLAHSQAMRMSTAAAVQVGDTSVEAEIALYKQEPGPPRSADEGYDFLAVLKWWKDKQHKFPNLAVLARMYLSVRATSCAAERLFSTAGQLVTPLRNAMGAEVLQEILFVRKNSDLSCYSKLRILSRDIATATG
jgi:hypothetical protein